MTLKFIPLPQILGCEVYGLDCKKKLSDSNKQKLISSLNQYQVLLIRNQDLNEKQYLNFAKNLGRISKTRAKFSRMENYPEISQISNIKQKGQKIGIIPKPESFHADAHDGLKPYRRVLLYGKILPKSGGDTLFANLRLAYQTLPDEWKKKFANKHITYENFYADQPNAIHPIVLKNSVNHLKALFAVKIYALAIDGMSEKTGMSWIRKLYNHIIKPEHIYRHHWQKGDLIIWDNLSLLHAGTAAPKHPRLLWRIQLH